MIARAERITRPVPVIPPTDKPRAATYYYNKERHGPRPCIAVILCGRRLRRTGEYPRLALARDEHDMRLDIAVGEEHLFLPLLGNADRP